MKINHISALVLSLMFFALARESTAAIRTVDTTSDSAALTACTSAPNNCSLRGAISGAAAGDTINFDASLNNTTITLGSLISINKTLTINGPGADKLTISGGNTTSLFETFTGSPITLNYSGLTFADGNDAGGNNSGQGGAIEVTGGSLATFDAVVFRDNTASALAGALVCGTTTCRISNSTFYNNSAPAASVLYRDSGTLEIVNTTITGNVETASTYGALYLGGNVVIRNSTIADNLGRSNIYASTATNTITLGNTIVAGGSASDIVRNGGSVATNGGNIIGRNNNAGPNFATPGAPNANADYVGTSGSQTDPQLAPLTIANGGTTPTRALLPGSPALNHGNNCVLNNSCVPAMSAALVNDQRGAGFSRQFGATNVDIGAFESQVPLTAAHVSISGRVLTSDGKGLQNAIIVLTDDSGNTRSARSSSFGYYRFDEVESGRIYVLGVESKKYRFTPRVLSLTDDLQDFNLIAEQQ